MSVVIARIIFKCGSLFDGGFYLGKTAAIEIVKNIDLEGNANIAYPEKYKFPKSGDDIIFNVETDAKNPEEVAFYIKINNCIEKQINDICAEVEYILEN
ncbi:hypothetical protein [Komagataeibacter europaeus]|uniref:hypothetical protein n=1 Tax=Komagataeibacter europaeus TaxID=33995 RepID=UPI0015FC92F3|nr:hypothetical protein [Komagataeibacter europaeus]